MNHNSTIPVLITSSVRVAADRTSIVDVDERIQWTLHGIRMWRKLNPESPLVVCDGSGADIRLQIQRAVPGGAPVEFLSFCNDFTSVRKFGKGRGEGEIIKHALSNSEYLRRAKRFCKCTAKLWVENHTHFVKSHISPFSFDYFGNVFPKRLDTRYYIADTAEFASTLADSYLLLNESTGTDLEAAYLNTLQKIPFSRYISRIAPLVSGMSGSLGTEYKPSRLRVALKSARNSLMLRVFGRARMMSH